MKNTIMDWSYDQNYLVIIILFIFDIFMHFQLWNSNFKVTLDIENLFKSCIIKTKKNVIFFSKMFHG